MRRILSQLVLPDEISTFERSYLARINRVALWFFVAHLPLFTGIAALNGTGAALALALTALGVAGPLVALRTVSNPRLTSVVFGVTAMYMGALLVHFGRGLWTIEMHFYFFVALALLAVFANPMVIVAAAVTVSLHHLLFWAIAPESLFNYEAPVTSVLVHALFVVVESVAAAFVARSFFDNVVGLEHIVAARTAQLAERTQEMGLIFEHVEQGFLMVSPDGLISAEHSRAIDRWLGEPTPQQPLWAFFSPIDERFAAWVEVAWSGLTDDLLPRDVVLAQLPSRLEVRGRTLEFSWQAVESEGTLERVLVLVSDATARMQREQLELEQRETVEVFERLMRDRAGFLEFFDESRQLVSELEGEGGLDERTQRRHVHTLKGTCGVFGVTSVARRCHQVETEASERPLAREDLRAVGEAWRAFSARVVKFLDEGARERIELDADDYLGIVHAISEGRPRAEVLQLIESWKNEPVRKRLERLGVQAQALARRLGKGEVQIEIDSATLRLPQEPFARVWASMVHVIRNAIDHGLGKAGEQASAPRLTFSARMDGEVLRVSVADNGRGIDWAKVAAAAANKGLPAGSSQELVDALFADGLSTAEVASEVSGRGVGLSAVRQACRELGGEVRVTSGSEGTRFDLELPSRLAHRAVA